MIYKMAPKKENRKNTYTQKQKLINGNKIKIILKKV